MFFFLLTKRYSNKYTQAVARVHTRSQKMSFSICVFTRFPLTHCYPSAHSEEICILSCSDRINDDHMARLFSPFEERSTEKTMCPSIHFPYGRVYLVVIISREQRDKCELKNEPAATGAVWLKRILGTKTSHSAPRNKSFLSFDSFP